MKYYCLGIKGTGMSSLAQILYDLGNEVSGYDDVKDCKFTQKGLDDRGIKIYSDSKHVLDKDLIVTYSVAVADNHPELRRVKELGLTIKKYNEVVGDITKRFDTIAVAGTHGKTTTASLVKHIINNTIGCNYFIGAGDGSVSKDNRLFVIESDEFNKHFLTYRQDYAIITNIEKEHMECYKDLDDIIDTFSQFASHTKNKIIACGDDINVRKLKTDVNIVYYGFNNDNDYIIRGKETTQDGSRFDLYKENELVGTFNVPLFGKPMILDTTAAIITCINEGIEVDEIKDLLSTFKNAKRRFAEEVISSNVIIDDYAHHPTEIKSVLDAVREKYKDKKVIAVFVPNTYSRTRDFTDEFVDVLKCADQVYLTEIDCNRENSEDYPGVSSHIITDRIDGADIISDETIDKLKSVEDSVICFMGCAPVAHLINAYKGLFE